MAIMRTTQFMLSFLLVMSLYSSLASLIQNVDVDPIMRAAKRDNYNCTRPMTCKECTRENCHWSIERQECQALPDGTLTVGSVKGCPTLTTVYDGRTFLVKVSNDMVGILNYAADVTVKCWRGPMDLSAGRVVVANNRTGKIVCKNHPTYIVVPQYIPASAIGSFYVTIGQDDVMLRTDDRARYYESALYDSNCSGRPWAKYCVACNNTEMYVQQCRKRTSGGKPRCVDWMLRQDDPQLSPDCGRGGAGQELCSQVAKTDVTFSPEQAAWDANVTLVTVNVNGHRMLSRNGVARVTVAGRECRHPFTVSEHQFRCTVHKSREAAADRSGTVLVEYGSDRRTVQFCGNEFSMAATIVVVALREVKESAATFTFVQHDLTAKPCDPKPAAGQTLAGILRGGTSSLIRWTGLECVHQKDSFLWYVEDTENRETRHWNHCHFLENSTSVCFAPITADPSTRDIQSVALGHVGPVRWFTCWFQLVEVATGRLLHIPCGGGYLSYADPEFDDFDVMDGGTTVVVYGRHIGTPAVRLSDVYVQLPGGGPTRDCVVQRMTDDRLECSVAQNLKGAREFVLKAQELVIYVATKSEEFSVIVMRRKITTTTTTTTTITPPKQAINFHP